MGVPRQLKKDEAKLLKLTGAVQSGHQAVSRTGRLRRGVGAKSIRERDGTGVAQALRDGGGRSVDDGGGGGSGGGSGGGGGRT